MSKHDKFSYLFWILHKLTFRRSSFDFPWQLLRPAEMVCQTELRTGAAVCGVSAVCGVYLSDSAVQYSTLECNTIQCNTVHWSARKYNEVQCNVVQWSTSQFMVNAVPLALVQCNSVNSSAIHCIIVQFSEGQFSTIKCIFLKTSHCPLTVGGNLKETL